MENVFDTLIEGTVWRIGETGFPKGICLCAPCSALIEYARAEGQGQGGGEVGI